MIDLDQLAVAVADEPPPRASPGKRLSELVRPGEDDPSELLKHRFLCRGGGLLLVGPTGIGKSSFAMQAMILWALGREAFGIAPPRPLRSLLVQAENDDGDLAEMRDGVIEGLGLPEADARQAMENIIVVREDARTGLLFFVETLQPALAAHRPDLLWIDPALAYLGGEANSQKDVGGFLRNLLNPLLREFDCGCMVVHHTNKPPTGKEKPDWQAGDFAYLGGGSAEWANWARAVIVLRSVGSHSVFELRAAKRGPRLRWREPDGVTPRFTKMIAHATEPGVICWREADASEVPAEEAPEKTAKRVFRKEDVLAHVPVREPMAKELLRSKANAAGIPWVRINGLLAELLEAGLVHEWLVKRERTRPQIWVARFAQSDGGLGV
ncbi:MAG: AAA family ATPase [Verrucomicrobia bacterium]|nr:AAA family ATPase [Verrucomicrobiota bacterium]